MAASCGGSLLALFCLVFAQAEGLYGWGRTFGWPSAYRRYAPNSVSVQSPNAEYSFWPVGWYTRPQYTVPFAAARPPAYFYPGYHHADYDYRPPVYDYPGYQQTTYASNPTNTFWPWLLTYLNNAIASTPQFPVDVPRPGSDDTAIPVDDTLLVSAPAPAPAPAPAFPHVPAPAPALPAPSPAHVPAPTPASTSIALPSSVPDVIPPLVPSPADLPPSSETTPTPILIPAPVPIPVPDPQQNSAIQYPLTPDVPFSTGTSVTVSSSDQQANTYPIYNDSSHVSEQFSFSDTPSVIHNFTSGHTPQSSEDDTDINAIIDVANLSPNNPETDVLSHDATTENIDPDIADTEESDEIIYESIYGTTESSLEGEIDIRINTPIPTTADITSNIAHEDGQIGILTDENATLNSLAQSTFSEDYTESVSTPPIILSSEGIEDNNDTSEIHVDLGIMTDSVIDNFTELALHNPEISSQNNENTLLISYVTSDNRLNTNYTSTDSNFIPNKDKNTINAISLQPNNDLEINSVVQDYIDDEDDEDDDYETYEEITSKSIVNSSADVAETGTQDEISNNESGAESAVSYLPTMIQNSGNDSIFPPESQLADNTTSVPTTTKEVTTKNSPLNTTVKEQLGIGGSLELTSTMPAILQNSSGLESEQLIHFTYLTIPPEGNTSSDFSDPSITTVFPVLGSQYEYGETAENTNDDILETADDATAPPGSSVVLPYVTLPPDVTEKDESVEGNNYDEFREIPEKKNDGRIEYGNTKTDEENTNYSLDLATDAFFPDEDDTTVSIESIQNSFGDIEGEVPDLDHNLEDIGSDESFDDQNDFSEFSTTESTMLESSDDFILDESTDTGDLNYELGQHTVNEPTIKIHRSDIPIDNNEHDRFYYNIKPSQDVLHSLVSQVQKRSILPKIKMSPEVRNTISHLVQGVGEKMSVGSKTSNEFIKSNQNSSLPSESLLSYGRKNQTVSNENSHDAVYNDLNIMPHQRKPLEVKVLEENPALNQGAQFKYTVLSPVLRTGIDIQQEGNTREKAEQEILTDGLKEISVVNFLWNLLKQEDQTGRKRSIDALFRIAEDTRSESLWKSNKAEEYYDNNMYEDNYYNHDSNLYDEAIPEETDEPSIRELLSILPVPIRQTDYQE